MAPFQEAIRRVCIPRRTNRAQRAYAIRGDVFSAGFGFVEFRRHTDAQLCMKRLQGPLFVLSSVRACPRQNVYCGICAPPPLPPFFACAIYQGKRLTVVS